MSTQSENKIKRVSPHWRKQQTVLPVLLVRRRLRRGEEGRDRVNPSIILTSEPSDSIPLPPVQGKSWSQLLSIKVAIVSIIWAIRSKNVLDESWVCKMGVLHGVNMMDNIRLEHELDWPLLLLRLLPPSHIFRLFLNMTVQVGSSPALTDIFPALL